MSTSNVEVDIHAISVYPNPTDGVFIIEGATSLYNIGVLSINGSLHQNFNSTGRVEIDLSALPSGLFFIRIENQSNGTLTIEKILKQN